MTGVSASQINLTQKNRRHAFKMLLATLPSPKKTQLSYKTKHHICTLLLHNITTKSTRTSKHKHPRIRTRHNQKDSQTLHQRPQRRRGPSLSRSPSHFWLPSQFPQHQQHHPRSLRCQPVRRSPPPVSTLHFLPLRPWRAHLQCNYRLLAWLEKPTWYFACYRLFV